MLALALKRGWLERKRTGRVDVTVGAAAAVLGSTVPFLEGANTNVLAEVDVAGDSSCWEKGER